MIIDSKLPGFKGYLNDFKLGVGTSKASLNQTTVTSTEQKSVNLDFDIDGQKKDSYKKEKNDQKKSSLKASTKSSEKKSKSDSGEDKKINMKLLNLI